MCISHEAAHFFAEPRYSSLHAYPTQMEREYDTPFGQLRCAQLCALGLEMDIAQLVAWYMLPLSPLADAGAERLLLDAVRFLIQHGLVRAARWADAEARDDAEVLAREEAVHA
jgi:hypothetical protein